MRYGHRQFFQQRYNTDQQGLSTFAISCCLNFKTEFARGCSVFSADMRRGNRRTPPFIHSENQLLFNIPYCKSLHLSYGIHFCCFMTICCLFCNDVFSSSSHEEHINLHFQDQLSFFMYCVPYLFCFSIVSDRYFIAEILPVPEDCYDDRVSLD